MKTIDINCDMGEGFGTYRMGDDAAMLNVVSTVNLACGFHAGDPTIMAHICTEAKRLGVAVGAHPGYPDLWGFGRRDIPYTLTQLKELLAYQIGAASGVASLAGHQLTHVKAHGAMGHLVSDDPSASEALVDVIKSIDASLILSVMASSALERIGDAAGLRLAREIYADRAYLDDGRLMPRNQPGAVIHDAGLAVERVLQMVEEQCIISHTGKRIPVNVDTVCVHGDTDGAVAIAKRIRSELEQKGFQIAPYAQIPA